MAKHTITNIASDGFIHAVGSNYTLRSGESVILEQWQLIPQDLDDISNGIFSVVPPLPQDLTGLNLGKIVFRDDPDRDLADDLEEVILDLRLTGVTAGAEPVTDNIIVTSNGQTIFPLSEIPVGGIVDLHVGPLQQVATIDYTISGSTLTWLNTVVLEIGDLLLISYFK